MDLHNYRTILMGQEYVITHQSTYDPISVPVLGSHRVRREWRSIIFK
jgi:hypothetical protein